jgi:hypothetical protein
MKLLTNIKGRMSNSKQPRALNFKKESGPNLQCVTKMSKLFFLLPRTKVRGIRGVLK